jgi:hypothetical protein
MREASPAEKPIALKRRSQTHHLLGRQFVHREIVICALQPASISNINDNGSVTSCTGELIFQELLEMIMNAASSS